MSRVGKKPIHLPSGVKVTVEFINQNDMPARATAAIESGTGADIMLMIQNQPHLYAKGLENHDKLVAELLGDDLYPFARGATTVDGVSRGVPIPNSASGQTVTSSKRSARAPVTKGSRRWPRAGTGRTEGHGSKP